MKTITHRSSWLLSKWSLMLCLISLFYTQRADAQACQFQQGQNGGVNAAVISPIDFARGNVNGSKAHYVEGNSIPYRIEFTTLSANTQYRALISFDVKKQTKHAMDFITGFQNLKYSTTDPPEQVNPIKGTGLDGVGGIVVNTFPIPNPTFSTDASYNTTATNAFTLLKTPAYFNPEVTVPASPLSAAVRDKGNIAIWNATINSIQYVNTINTNLSDVHATFEVIFTKANNANPVVMAWGGHISSTQTWGEGLSAHDIPGSPYHMYVETVETSDGVNTICNGNMDCQLSSNAVSILPTCSISGPTIACPETNLLTYTATLDAATFGAVNYTWLLTNGTPSAGAQLTGTLSGSTTAASMIREVTPLVTDFIAGGKFRLQLTVERDGNSAVCYLNSSSAPGDSVLINDVATTASASPTSFSLNTTSISNLSATTLLNGVTDNGAFTYAWTVTSPGGLNGGSLTGVSTRTPQFTAVNPGTYKFRVTATQTAAPNCVDIDSVTVVVTAKQACPTVPRNPLCADATSATYTASTPPDTDVTYIWLVNNGTVITSANGLQSVTVDPGTISFTLSLVLDYANPSILNDTCSYPVTVNPLPVVNTGSYGPYCIDATPVTLSGTPSGGTWSGPGVTGSTFNVQTAGVGTHQIIYNYTDANGCSAADTTSIVVNALPSVNTGTYGPYCIDATPVTLSGTPSGGTWSGPGVTGTTFNVQTAGVGTHQIIYNYTNANGCSAADTTSIVVNPLPVVNTGSYGPYCIDATPVTLSGTPSGGTWSGPGVSGTTLNVQTAGVGTHQIIYNYTNANGCSAADTTNITVNPLPVVNTGAYGPYCIDATPVTLSGTPSGGTWSGPGVSGTTFNVQTAGVGTHQIIYNYTNANGCSAADTTSIVVNPLPVVNTGSYGPYCIDATPVTLSGTPSGGTWSGPGVSGTTFNVQTAGVGTHQIIYNYTDPNGCSAADTTSITVYNLPTVVAGSYGPYCIDASPVILGGTPSGGIWSGTGVTGTTFNVQTAGVGTHELIYTYTNGSGCTNADTISITVNPLPVVNTGSYGPYCIDATPVTLSGTPSGGTWSGPGVSGTTFNIQTAGVGTHQIIYNYTDANGCSAADTTSIVVNPLPVVNTGSYGPYCIDATPVTLSGTPSGGMWSGPGVSGTTFNIQTAGVGTHQIIYNYTDANGCSAADTTSIVVNALPSVNTGSYGPYCIDATPVTLSGTPSGGTWSGPGVSGTTFNVQTAGVGTHQIIYNYTDANGCSAADTTSIIINPLPVVNTGSYDPVCDNETTVSLTGTPSGGTWSGPGVSGTTFNVQTAGIGTHQLIYNYSDANGCSAADTTEIVVEDCGDDDFCTYTQGYFGSKNGKACDGDSLYQNPVSLIRSLLLPGNIILGAGVRTITITVNDSVRVNMVMPGGSTPRALTHTGNISMSQLGAYNYLNRQGRLNNVFLSQTLALSLNLRINTTLMHFTLDSGYLVTQKLANCGDTTTTLSCEMDSSAIQSWPMNSSVVGYLEENGGATVENLLMLANKLLGQVLMPGASGAGATMVPSYSAVSGMVSTINEAFDECRVFLLYNPTKMECPEMGITQRYVDVPVEPTRSTIRVNAFPNPYGKLVQFSMTANIDGQAELSLFDLSGRQLAQLYQGIWKAGDWRLINYAIKPGQAIPMIYRFRVGKEVVTGKLMPGN